MSNQDIEKEIEGLKMWRNFYASGQASKDMNKKEMVDAWLDVSDWTEYMDRYRYSTEDAKKISKKEAANRICLWYDWRLNQLINQ